MNSALAFLGAAADSACEYSDGLNRAYVGAAPAYVNSISIAQRPHSYCYEPLGGAGTSCMNDSSATKWEFTATQDAGYNLLGKAIIAYNQGANARLLTEGSYFTSLLGSPRRTSDNEFSPTHFGYWLGVKLKSQAIRADLGGYLPFVAYLWPGNDSDGDGNPDWCFAYGEKEWIAGVSFIQAQRTARGDALAEPPILPIGQINCITGQSI